MRTPLGAGLVLLAVLEGCSTTTPDQSVRRAALWAAATECASGKASLKVDGLDAQGRIHVTLLQGAQQDVPAFTACYNQKAKDKLAMAVQVTGPAQIVESPSDSVASTRRPSLHVMSVPIQAVNNRYLVPVVLNESQTATFLIDTGANITVVTPDLARRAGAEAPSRPLKATARTASGEEVAVSLVRLKSIRVGLARIDNFSVAVYEFGVVDTGAKPPIPVDGFLGADFLGRFTMTVDPRAGTLTLQLNEPAAR